MRHLAIVPILVLTSALAGCASFSPDGGMGVVSDVTEKAIVKDVALFAPKTKPQLSTSR